MIMPHLRHASVNTIHTYHKLQALYLIPQRIERQTYSYQKYTLPIKLRNLVICCSILYKCLYLKKKLK